MIITKEIMFRRYFPLIIMIFSLATTLVASSYEDMTIQAYVEHYRDYAVAEMHRSGVPASIKLAQGILESNAGRSELAVQANNHFGMKCGSAWTGPTYYKKDDDRDRKGNLIESCFRVFNSPYESYVEHSEFLRDPRKEYRYGSLFDIDITDYRSWAWGLKQAGYATNPKYANLLINIIEKYDLFTYDYYEGAAVLFDDPVQRTIASRIEKENPDLLNDDLHESEIKTDIAKEIVEEFEKNRRIGFINKTKVVYAKEGETLNSIGKQYGVRIKRLKRYNEVYRSDKERLHEGDIVFLEKKKRSYSGHVYRHVVKDDETYEDLSQQYGVRLKHLLKKNDAKKDDTLSRGDIVHVQGNVAPLPEVTEEEITTTEQTDKSGRHVRHHLLRDGETLFGVAKKYGLTMDELLELNPGLSDMIYVGMRIRVE